MSRRFVAKGLDQLAGLQQNIAGCRFEDELEVETAVTRSMLREGTDRFQRGITKVIT